MQRINPTVIAASVLGALILLILVMMFIGSRSSEDDRLTGEEVARPVEDPAELCSSKATAEQIKGELFRQAGTLRSVGQEPLGDIASYSSVRMESVVLRDESADGGATCNGTLTLALPEGVVMAGGRRSLSADLLYAVQPGTEASGSVVTLSNAEQLIAQLATAGRNPIAAVDDGLTNSVANDVIETPITPSDPLDPLPGAGPAPSAGANPSFNCSNARTPSETAVCNDPGLAALDRRMVSQYSSALAQADPEQRALLTRTRDAFLGYRDQCTGNACIADTYRGRMREIRDIMNGTWTPQR